MIYFLGDKARALIGGGPSYLLPEIANVTPPQAMASLTSFSLSSRRLQAARLLHSITRSGAFQKPWALPRPCATHLSMTEFPERRLAVPESANGFPSRPMKSPYESESLGAAAPHPPSPV
jgi:hypothetical protein